MPLRIMIYFLLKIKKPRPQKADTAKRDNGRKNARNARKPMANNSHGKIFNVWEEPEQPVSKFLVTWGG